MQKIIPCLWFDTRGEDAARFYTSVFPRKIQIDELERAAEAAHV